MHKKINPIKVKVCVKCMHREQLQFQMSLLFAFIAVWKHFLFIGWFLKIENVCTFFMFKKQSSWRKVCFLCIQKLCFLCMFKKRSTWRKVCFLCMQKLCFLYIQTLLFVLAKTMINLKKNLLFVNAKTWLFVHDQKRSI